MRYVSAEISDGLGNRLFQVAAILGYAEKYDCTPTLIKDWIKPNNHSGPKTIFDFFPELQTINASGMWTVLEQPWDLGYTYVDLPCGENNVKLKGFFQSEKFFPRAGIPRPSILHGLETRFRDFAFLHVRRGDYLLPVCAHHNVDLRAYYRYALSFFADSSTRILVCSDDITWCRTEFQSRYADLVPSDRWEFFEGSDYETLRAMTACSRGGIAANSTFSWWGAYWNIGRGSGGIYTMPSVWGYIPLPPAVDLHPDWATVLPV